MRLRWASVTDPGRVRPQNQDQVFAEEPLFAVADGMGGHAAGDVAAQVAIEALRTGFTADPTAEGLVAAFRQADTAVWERSVEQADTRGMGTTLTAAAVITDGDAEVLEVANVGDSRAYLLRDGELEQISDDHSLVGDLLRAGRISEEEATDHPQRHIVTRSIGVEYHGEASAELVVDTFRVIPYRGDRVLLASDGLSDMISDEQIASVLRRLADPDDAAGELCRLAKAAGGNDNISVVIVDVIDDDDKAGAASAALADEPPPPTKSAEPAIEEPTTNLRADREDMSRETHASSKPPRARRTRRRPKFTLRALAFVVAVLVVLALAVGAITWYAKGSYYVGVRDDRVTIFRGRPGGFLWVKPTVVERTALSLDDVAPFRQEHVRDGQPEPTLNAAKRYVRNLQDEADALTTTTTTPPVETTTTIAP